MCSIFLSLSLSLSLSPLPALFPRHYGGIRSSIKKATSSPAGSMAKMRRNSAARCFNQATDLRPLVTCSPPLHPYHGKRTGHMDLSQCHSSVQKPQGLRTRIWPWMHKFVQMREVLRSARLLEFGRHSLLKTSTQLLVSPTSSQQYKACHIHACSTPALLDGLWTVDSSMELKA